MATHKSTAGRRGARTDARPDRRTTAQLRDALPSRRTPGKTSARDVAAAPFDTDDEAAGRPPEAAAIERAAERDAPPHPPKYPAATPSSASTWVVGTALALLIAVALLWVITH